jgi:Tfp pilus assembly protein PilO
MFLTKLSRKEKIGLFVAVVVVFLAILDRLVLAPIKERIQQINQQIQVNEKQLVMGLRNLEQKEVVTNEYKKYARYLKDAGSDEERIAAMLSEIENLAKKSGVSLVDTKPSQPKDTNFFKEYAIEVKAEGTMETLMIFLYQLNSSSQLLRAERLRLNLKDKDSITVEASILITKFLLP